MIFVTLLLNIILIFINVSADSHTNDTIPFISIDEPTYYRLSDNLLPEDISNVTNNYRLTNHIIPTYYDIWINLSYTEQVSIDGEIGIDLTILHPTRTINFHAQRPYLNIRDYALFFHSNDINNTTCTSRTITNTTNNTACIALTHNLIMKSYNYASHILVLHFDKTLPRGNYTLKMRFKTNINNEDNFYRIISHLKIFNSTSKQDTRWPLFIVFTHAIGARQIFPCWDEPNFKAVFRFALTHDFNYLSFSNMLVKPSLYAVNKRNEIWGICKNTPKIPTYSLILPIYLNKPITSDINFGLNPVQYISDESEDTEFARVIANNTLHWISKWNNVTYDKFFDIIVLPNWPKKTIMPKRGYVIFRKADITYKKEIDNLAHKIGIASLVAREIIQLWLSHKVNPSWWSSLWINDGIAVLLEMKALNEILPNARIMDLFTVQMRYESLHLDELIKPLTWNVTTPSDINSVVSHFRYVKAPAILRMLQHIISDEVFEKGLKIYLQTDESRSATLNDFWTAMQTAYDESPKQKYANYNNFSIARMMNAWINNSHYPVVKLNLYNYYEDSNKNVFSLMTLSLDKPYISRQYKWWIPFTVITEQTNPKWISLNNFLIINSTFFPYLTLPWKGLDTDKWILIDVQQAEYYRINYNIDNWKKLASYLKSQKYTKIHVLNRAKLIDDSFHLAIANRLNYNIFWNISSYLHQDTDYIAWYPMFKAIEHMSSIFAFSNYATIKIKENINNVLGGLLERIGYQDVYNDDDLTMRLRQEAIKWACNLDFHGCINAAQQQMKEYISLRFISPWWRKIAFCYGVNANSKTWADAIRMFKFHYYVNQRKEAISILESLACIKNERVIKAILQRKVVIKILAYLKVFSRLQVMDHIKLFFAIVAKHAKNDKIMEYILSNFEKVKPRKTSLLVVLINLINYSYSEVQLNKIHTFALNVTDNEQYKNIKNKLNIRRIQIRRQEYYSGFYY